MKNMGTETRSRRRIVSTALVRTLSALDSIRLSHLHQAHRPTTWTQVSTDLVLEMVHWVPRDWGALATTCKHFCRVIQQARTQPAILSLPLAYGVVPPKTWMSGRLTQLTLTHPVDDLSTWLSKLRSLTYLNIAAWNDIMSSGTKFLCCETVTRLRLSVVRPFHVWNDEVRMREVVRAFPNLVRLSVGTCGRPVFDFVRAAKLERLDLYVHRHCSDQDLIGCVVPGRRQFPRLTTLCVYGVGIARPSVILTEDHNEVTHLSFGSGVHCTRTEGYCPIRLARFSPSRGVLDWFSHEQTMQTTHLSFRGCRFPFETYSFPGLSSVRMNTFGVFTVPRYVHKVETLHLDACSPMELASFLGKNMHVLTRVRFLTIKVRMERPDVSCWNEVARLVDSGFPRLETALIVDLVRFRRLLTPRLTHRSRHTMRGDGYHWVGWNPKQPG